MAMHKIQKETMIPLSKDYSTSRMDQMKDNIHNNIKVIGISRDLKAEDKGVNTDGKAQAKPGQVEMDVSSVHNNALVVRPVAGPLMLIDLK
jgi:hypothetical protein